MAGQLELKRRVADVEVAAQALLQRVEDDPAPAVGEHVRLDDDVHGQHRQPGRDRPRVQVVHVAHAGLASSSTSIASASSRQVRGRISTPTSSAAIGSARVKPLAAMTIPVTMTAAAPSASEATSRNAPLMFRLSAWPCRKISRLIALAASATTPKTMSSGDSTAGGEVSLLTASTMMKTDMPNRTTALTIAARI